MTELTLERRDQADETAEAVAPGGGKILMTPAIDEDYWAYRVRLSEKQSILGFPKFLTIGIGFAVEGYDWNVNLPYTETAEVIFRHIHKNKGDDAITDESVIEAIRLVQAAATEDRGR